MIQLYNLFINFIDCFKMADETGLLAKPDLAVARMNQLLAVYGIA